MKQNQFSDFEGLSRFPERFLRMEETHRGPAMVGALPDDFLRTDRFVSSFKIEYCNLVLVCFKFSALDSFLVVLISRIIKSIVLQKVRSL